MQLPISEPDYGRILAPRLTENADYWRCRAEEALEVAYEMSDPAAISKMLKIGRQYERLARQAEERNREAL